MVGEEGYENEQWNESYDGYWADDPNWNDGYWANDVRYYMDEHGYFQKKRKEKKRKDRNARKARMMMAKEENQEMAKVSLLCATSSIINTRDSKSTSTSSLFFCSIKLWTWVYRFC